ANAVGCEQEGERRVSALRARMKTFQVLPVALKGLLEPPELNLRPIPQMMVSSSGSLPGSACLQHGSAQPERCDHEAGVLFGVVRRRSSGDKRISLSCAPSLPVVPSFPGAGAWERGRLSKHFQASTSGMTWPCTSVRRRSMALWRKVNFS